MEKPTNPQPEGQPEVPDERQVDVTPGVPVSFEVPANTNLVINVVSPKPEGCLASLFSGLSCIATGFVVLVVFVLIIGALTP